MVLKFLLTFDLFGNRLLGFLLGATVSPVALTLLIRLYTEIRGKKSVAAVVEDVSFSCSFLAFGLRFICFEFAKTL
ncbi:hypothetical protein [Ferruginibacter sp.]